MMSIDSNLPFVSILIRSIGRPELKQALDSVAKQSYRQIEVLVVDAVGDQVMISQYIPVEYPYSIRVLSKGLQLQRSTAANMLLEHAEGDLGIFLDDDDWFYPNHVEKLVLEHVANPSSPWFYTGVECIENNQRVRIFDDEFSASRLLIENYIPIHAVIFNLMLIKNKKITFDNAFDLFEDWDFWLQCLEVAPFVHIPGVSAVYRIHGNSGVGVRTKEAGNAELALRKLIEKWQYKWTIDQLQDLFAHARIVNVLKVENNNLYQEISNLNQELLNQRSFYEKSKSWRLTQPLRTLKNSISSLSVQKKLKSNVYFARFLLKIGTYCYKQAFFSHFLSWIPASVKRRVRNNLMVYSQSGTVPVPKGLKISRPLGACPMVSIIIPVYNHSQYVEKCVRSALAQDWPALEVIVVDDASPDEKIKPILNSLLSDPRLIVHFLPHNVGICQTQNQGLMIAKGDIIAFLDCDDYLPSHAISSCIKVWQDDTVYLHTGRINVDENECEISRIHFMSLPRQDYFGENLRSMYATHLKLIRKDVFSRVGLFDPRFDSAQDYEMLMRIAFHYPSTSFVHLPEFLYFHRIHAQQTTQTQRKKQDHLTGLIQKEARLRESIRQGDFNKFISFIMLSYGKHSQTLAAINGLCETVHIPHEIILYDNGSTAETVTFIRENIDGKFANVKVIYGEKNLGPAQGRRQALEYSSGEWFIIFDNDELPEVGWLEELLLRACTEKNVGAVCCRVAFPDGKLQFSGGQVLTHNNQIDVIDLALFDRGEYFESLSTCVFRQVDWCPIGATLFTVNIKNYLHDGYPNTFEDAGVSFSLKKQGLRLLNAPGALIWHEHITFQPKAEMKEQYLRDRYNHKMMLKSVASFYYENGLLIYDEYIWRENGLHGLSRKEIESRLNEAVQLKTSFS